ncbi:MAG: glycosyltransferase family 4 protein [Fimbriimonadaceae bacterium]|nr:glycosyltransferase family 4 protein [Fimbriimonadaceae bacterium]
MYRDLVVALDARLMGSRNTGDTSYWRGLVSGLAGTDHNARILLLSNVARPEFIPDDPRLEWIVVDGRGGRWWSLFSFARAARRFGANVVHGQYTLSPLIRAGGVTTIHDVSFFIGPEWFRPRDRVLLSRTVPATCRRAARIITVSETSKEEIERFIPAARGKVRVTYNAVAPQRRRLTDDEAVSRRQRLGVPEKYLLTVGTRWPRKNMALAIHAAEVAGWPLVVTGQPGWGDEPPGTAVATGFVDDDDLNALYQGATLYLAPSWHEGFGIPILEAFALGCPVICGKGGAMPEVAGNAAQVMSSYDVSEWANAIQELTAQPGTLDSMRERGYRRVQQFSWQETARRTLEVYREAAACLIPRS